MITHSNLRQLLLSIGFEKAATGDCYKRTYNLCDVVVDFDNRKILYPEAKGFKVHDKTTSNFEHDENFVVLECVCRLLDKGYRPEHIELEPRWTLGHDAKGGKADILVRDEKGHVLLIIECKTAGTEFNKEKKNTEEDGGQLFSYWQQENATRWLALYASDWKDDTLTYKCLVINCTDDANITKIAEKDKDVRIYANARNDKERFEIWSETYQQQWLDDIIFSDESCAYQIGVPPLRKKQLRDFTPDDRIVNRFEEILRHNNVSDKENAFNRLVALFICKLVDEIKKQDFDEVDFQYKQGSDTYETLQDRLQRLHQQGMEEFMREKIFYVEADYAERLFSQYTGRQRKAAIEDLNRTIRILKFYSNNDFAFKDVHNEELFLQNGKILVEVVQLFQSYRIVYPAKHQFLGDLFEQLLNKGFKQNEGQFFTPTPITRFIWDSLPLQHYISAHNLPRVIDYACGAGHFLTEAVEAVNAVRKDGDNSWVEKHIYGVEKDYRLARVSKISMFMNGAGGANIIFGDGLENYAEKDITNGSFDILVANPPYSVSGFKQHLKLKDNAFHILNTISTDGSEIETLFVERTAQLLKPQGLAAVILPASILSNSSGSYIAAREQLLQNFLLRAIVNFGSKTFGATGTNTVVLFLERYNEPPRVSEMAKDTVEGITTADTTTDWQDAEVLHAYLQHQGIDEETYHQFLTQTLTREQLSANTYFKMYVDAFAFDAVRCPRNTTDIEKAAIQLKKFYDFVLSVEREKLYYFALVLNQRTLVISAPTDNKEQKAFLGYDWSNRKGAEGIVITNPGGQLYNAGDRFARGTLACAIRNTYIDGATTTSEISDNLAQFAKSYPLKDMIEFGVIDFNKSISTFLQESIRLQSKFPLVGIGRYATLIRGVTYSKSSQVQYETPNIVLTADNITLDGHFELNKKIFIDENVHFDAIKQLRKGDCFICLSSGSKKHVGKVAFITEDTDYYIGGFMGILRTISSLLNAEYLALILNSNQMRAVFQSKSTGANIQNLSSSLLDYEIPLPPLDIQQQIVDECKKIDEEYNTSRMTIELYRRKIGEVFENLDVITNSQAEGVKIKDLCSVINPSKAVVKNMDDDTLVSFIDMSSLSNEGFIIDKEDRPLSEVRKGSYTYFAENDVIIAKITPCMENGKCALAQGLTNGIGFGSSEFHIFRANAKVLPLFLFFSLNRQKVRDEAAKNMTGASGHRRVPISFYENWTIPVPSIQEQKSIVAQITSYEAEIAKARTIMDTCQSRKQAVLDKYLG